MAAESSVIACRVDYAVVIDKAGRIWSADAGVAEVLGYQACDAVGHHVWEVVHPEDVPRAISYLERLDDLGFRQPTLVVRCRHADGSWRRCEAPAYSLDDGTIMLGLRWLDAVDPDTAPDSMLDGLRRRAGVESRYDCLYVADTDGVITMIEEDQLRDVFGYEPADVIGRPLWEFVHPDDLAAGAEAFCDEAAFVDYRGTSKVIRILRADFGWRRCEVHGWNRLSDPELRGIVVGLRYLQPSGTLTPGKVTAAAWDQLTPAERDIVTAVSCGLSNKQIATNTQKSIRTVESQLGTIYRKLGIGSRSELIAEVLARP
jgi:PAS domain S-box-containing protein